jgi:hypothetical protein
MPKIMDNLPNELKPESSEGQAREGLAAVRLFGSMVDLEEFCRLLSTVGLAHKQGEVRRFYVMPPGPPKQGMKLEMEPNQGWSKSDQKRLGTMVVFRAVTEHGRLVWKFTIPSRSPLDRFWPTWWEPNAESIHGEKDA